MYMQNQVISKKKMNQKMKGCYVKNFATFCRCFEKHSTEKHSTEKNKENIHVRTVYNLFDHLNNGTFFRLSSS